MRRRTKFILSSSPLSLLALLAACDKPQANPQIAPVGANSTSQRTGDLLLAHSNCIACHSADAAVRANIAPLAAPSLRNIGDRASSSWINTYLNSHAHTGETGMRMPDVFSQVAATEVSHAILTLAAYLSSLHASPDESATLASVTSVATPEPPTTFPSQLNSGERLWRTLGCAACHASAADGALTDESWLADKFTRPALVEFLLDPSTVWPDGQMPNFDLTSDEATSIASYLLRGQGRAADRSFALTKTAGLSCNYYEGTFMGVGPGPILTPTRMDTMGDVDIPTFARADLWGMRLTTTLTIPVAGSWTLWLGSDDGSSLALDGEVLIESPGVQGFGFKSATRELSAGPHALLITYFEGAGDADLRLEWRGPRTAREKVPATAYTREAIALRAPHREPDASRDAIEAGRAFFTTLGCVQCHGPPETQRVAPITPPSYTQLNALTLTRGCLSETPTTNHAPDFSFTAAERDALRANLANIDELARPRPASETLAVRLLALNCTACHTRESVGGPSPHALALFEGTADIGEQGRVPPTLTGAGAKLRISAIDDVLAGTGSVRPYLRARMPRFGSASTSQLSALFAAADNAPARESDPPMREEILAEGRQLVGSEGFACIACHGCAGHPAAGVPAIDLSYTYARIRNSWFEKYMRNPAAIYPGTRMPSFWQPGQPVHTEILAGDSTKQISAIWSYLALGSSMPLPKGLVPGSAYELAPTDRPIVLGTFMDGLSARCFAVGFADQLHYVYDAEHCRTGMAWRGRFMDAAGTWFGRAGLLCEPAGFSVIEFPAGDAIALLQSNAQGAPQSWPLTTGRESGWRFLGVDRDGENVPTFRTVLGEIEVQERLAPARAVGGAHLVREFVIRSKREIAGLTVRAWVATSIEARDQGFKAASGPTIFVTGGGAFVRDGALLIPVGFRTGVDEERPYEAHIRLEYVW